MPGQHHDDTEEFIETAGAAQAGTDKARDRRNLRRVLVVLAGLIAVVLVAVVAVGGWYLNRVDNALDKVERKPSLMPTDAGTAVAPTPKTASDKQPMTFVLLGSDTRGTDQGRSDVLMTAFVPGNRQQVYLTSYPRDLWVPIPGRGDAKINAAYAWGGPALTVRTLQDLTGVKMDHVAVIDFESFIKLTDVLGGVTVNNKVASRQGEYTWPKGQVTVRGEEALAFVRQRKELPNGDFDRAERQRAVVQAIIVKLLSRGVLTNPSTFDQVLQQLAGTVTVDDGLTNDKIRSLATSMRIGSAADVRSLQVPITGFGTSADKQSIAILDKGALNELSTAMKTDSMDDFWATHKDDCRFTASGC